MKFVTPKVRPRPSEAQMKNIAKFGAQQMLGKDIRQKDRQISELETKLRQVLTSNAQDAENEVRQLSNELEKAKMLAKYYKDELERVKHW